MSVRAIIALGALLFAVAIGLGAGGAIYGPRLFTARQAAETATDAGVSANLAVDGARQSAAEVDRHHDLIDALTDKTHALELEAQKDPSADAPVPDALRDRLRRHDDILCDARPGLCPDRQGNRAPGPAAPG